MKQGQRAMWSAGDYPSIAEFIEDGSLRTLARLGVESGDRLLDVATGSGNAAIPAAQAGATVIGLDLTPELFDAARERAANAAVEIDWIEGDAEDLPFDDDSFDKVVSVFGAMFAPRHQRAADEIVRVTKPGGRFAVTAWTPEGLNGQMFITTGSHMPAQPPEFQPPVLWGTEDHVRSLFEGSGAELEFERAAVKLEFDNIDEWLEIGETKLGPIIMAKAALEPHGKYDALREDLLSLYERFNTADDGTLRCEAEYLITSGTLPS